jgi:hypothetical protein
LQNLPISAARATCRPAQFVQDQRDAMALITPQDGSLRLFKAPQLTLKVISAS